MASPPLPNTTTMGTKTLTHGPLVNIQHPNHSSMKYQGLQKVMELKDVYFGEKNFEIYA